MPFVETFECRKCDGDSACIYCGGSGVLRRESNRPSNSIERRLARLMAQMRKARDRRAPSWRRGLMHQRATDAVVGRPTTTDATVLTERPETVETRVAASAPFIPYGYLPAPSPPPGYNIAVGALVVWTEAGRKRYCGRNDTEPGIVQKITLWEEREPTVTILFPSRSARRRVDVCYISSVTLFER